MSQKNHLEQCSTIYIDIISSFLTEGEKMNEKLLLRDIRPFWCGIDSAFQNLFQFYSSFLSLFQSKMEKKYGMPAIGGYEGIIESIDTADSMRIFYQELCCFINKGSFQNAFSMTISTVLPQRRQVMFR